MCLYFLLKNIRQVRYENIRQSVKFNVFYKTVARVSYILSSSNLKNTISKCIKQIYDWRYSKLTSSKIRVIYIVFLHDIVLCTENCFSHMYNTHVLT